MAEKGRFDFAQSAEKKLSTLCKNEHCKTIKM